MTIKQIGTITSIEIGRHGDYRLVYELSAPTAYGDVGNTKEVTIQSEEVPSLAKRFHLFSSIGKNIVVEVDRNYILSSQVDGEEIFRRKYPYQDAHSVPLSASKERKVAALGQGSRGPL